MTERITFSSEQAAQYSRIEDGLDALRVLGIDYRKVLEPLEDLQHRIICMIRDGGGEITVDMKDKG